MTAKRLRPQHSVRERGPFESGDTPEQQGSRHVITRHTVSCLGGMWKPAGGDQTETHKCSGRESERGKKKQVLTDLDQQEYGGRPYNVGGLRSEKEKEKQR